MIYTLDGEVSKLPLPKFSLKKIVNAQRESVFEVFSNFENYQQLIPQHFPSVRILFQLSLYDYGFKNYFLDFIKSTMERIFPISARWP